MTCHGLTGVIIVYAKYFMQAAGFKIVNKICQDIINCLDKPCMCPEISDNVSIIPWHVIGHRMFKMDPFVWINCLISTTDNCSLVADKCSY